MRLLPQKPHAILNLMKYELELIKGARNFSNEKLWD